MPKFYMTFGSGQPLEGYVLPLIANDELQARQYMFDFYEGNWCGTYEEKEWNQWRTEKPSWVPLERELKTVDISGIKI